METIYNLDSIEDENYREHTRQRFLNMWREKGNNLIRAVEELSDLYRDSYASGERELRAGFERRFGMDDNTFYTPVDLRLPYTVNDSDIRKMMSTLAIIATAVSNYTLEV